MHELYIAESIHRIVTDEAEKDGATKVVSLTVEVGALSGVVKESLEFVFPSVTLDGPAEGARLIIEAVAGAGHCPACDQSFELDDFLSPCPQCGHLPVEITAGRELRVKEIEVE